MVECKTLHFVRGTEGKRKENGRITRIFNKSLVTLVTVPLTLPAQRKEHGRRTEAKRKENGRRTEGNVRLVKLFLAALVKHSLSHTC